jgi:hypothetical protein
MRPLHVSEVFILSMAFPHSLNVNKKDSRLPVARQAAAWPERSCSLQSEVCRFQMDGGGSRQTGVEIKKIRSNHPLKERENSP